jgi:hypothetical protein
MKRTQKRRSIKPYTVFQTGNIIICTRIPIRKMVKYNMNRFHGGAENDNDYLKKEIFQNLVSMLESLTGEKYSDLLKYLRDGLKTSADKDGLLKFIFSKKNELEYANLFKAIQNRKLNMREIDKSPQKELIDLLSNKVTARRLIDEIKTKVGEIPTMDENDKKSVINSLENGVGMSMTSMSSKAMNSLKNGLHFISGFFLPNQQMKPNQKKWNETNIEILFYDKDHLHYRKGDSLPAIRDNETRFGDFMVINKPTKYANTSEYFKNITESVEDLFASIATSGENLLCTGNSEKCKKFSVKRKPIASRMMRIVNTDPEKYKM